MFYNILLSIKLLVFSNIPVKSAQIRRTVSDGNPVKQYIAVVNAKKLDETADIQALIDRAKIGDTVIIGKGDHYVRTLYLREGIHIESRGWLKQLPSDSMVNFSIEKQYSSYPLLYGKNLKDVSLSLKAETRNEAIHLDSCENVKVENSYFKGDFTKVKSFAGIYLLACRGVRIENSKIANYGVPREDTHHYQPGTGIRIQSCQNIQIRDNEIFKNGENGVFFHASKDVELVNNRIHHNGMSGIQIAFGSAGVERNYKIVENRLEENAADGIDINNMNERRLVDLNAHIARNFSKANGWVNGKKTPDGSGIATLVGVSNVMVSDNKSLNNNRPALYIRSCDRIQAQGNEADDFAELVGKNGQVHLKENQLGGLRVLAGMQAEKLMLQSNTIRDISFPSSISVDSLILQENRLHGNIHINMNGLLAFRKNTLSSKSPRGAISIWKVDQAYLEDNDIKASDGNAISIYKEANSILLNKNDISATKACIEDLGSKKLKIVGNRLNYSKLKGSEDAIVAIDPHVLELQSNEYYARGKRTDRSIRLKGSGSVYADGEKLIF
ncbi:right-handed parallel beta-helix repeat-containing protein [Olivibacter sp. SDN3]|uniref:right-handed parallel beta-helix repeat-containing protein n=1 Tax=Olivibacter sp. SDN3 TaxID=2764720 RepID=UPI001650F1A5|nr:right-handed parallel beta-helix repeat-containing protein [Olivibacter sp. SDN3]QNL50202.1 right-handed parallel beta-helix repeat-containing protein [Olivibacter sp. SDN3]